MRLAKYLAHAGVASRRAAEEIVRAGRVTVDGEIVEGTPLSAEVIPQAVRVIVPAGTETRSEQQE